MQTNKKSINTLTTHEGGKAQSISPLQQIRRIAMTCLLFEDNFYIDGKTLAESLEKICEKVKKEDIVKVALEAHQKGLLRHFPLFLILQAIKKGALCKHEIAKICSRPDQMTELLSLYWKDGKRPIASQLKKGLALAFRKFDHYQLSKYNRDNAIKLRDVLFLCHAKPRDIYQEELWKKLIDNKLQVADTWETRLSSGANKNESFTELLEAGRMGKLAILRNLRNMLIANVDKGLVERALLKPGRPILPFQFLTAAKQVPEWEAIIDTAMLTCLQSHRPLKGVTVLLVDVSGSMSDALSKKSTTTRLEAANGLAILLREICEEVEVFTFSETLIFVPARRGMALAESINRSQAHSCTYLGNALLRLAGSRRLGSVIDRLIVITDEQSSDNIPNMQIENCYMINVAPYQYGVANTQNWHHINGFSEHVVDYIQEYESGFLSPISEAVDSDTDRDDT